MSEPHSITQPLQRPMTATIPMETLEAYVELQRAAEAYLRNSIGSYRRLEEALVKLPAVPEVGS